MGIEWGLRWMSGDRLRWWTMSGGLGRDCGGNDVGNEAADHEVVDEVVDEVRD